MKFQFSIANKNFKLVRANKKLKKLQVVNPNSSCILRVYRIKKLDRLQLLICKFSYLPPCLLFEL